MVPQYVNPDISTEFGDDRLGILLAALSKISFNTANVSSAATIRVSPVITTVGQKIVSANSSRKGLILFNNSSNSVYVALGSAANSANNMTFIMATFSHLILPMPIYLGDVFGIRNAGTGTVLSTELT